MEKYIKRHEEKLEVSALRGRVSSELVWKVLKAWIPGLEELTYHHYMRFRFYRGNRGCNALFAKYNEFKKQWGLTMRADTFTDLLLRRALINQLYPELMSGLITPNM